MVKNLKKDAEDFELSNKIVDLCLWYQIEDSHRWIELISHKIKMYELKKEHLLDNKPFKFQKRKLKEYNNELESIEEEISKCYQEINEEVTIIEKMRKAIES